MRESHVLLDADFAIGTTDSRLFGVKAFVSVPALASQNGYIEHVAGAGHANLLGRSASSPHSSN